MKSHAYFALALSVMVTACAAQSELIDRKRELVLQAPSGTSVSVQVEIADTHATREKGLMFRERLEPDSGMLFVFDDSTFRYFWMKNTYIPLDVLFFETNGMWVSTASMQPCTQDPCISYSSSKPAKYALEVPLGWAEKNGVGSGWRIILE